MRPVTQRRGKRGILVRLLHGGLLALLAVLVMAPVRAPGEDPLPSWKESASKQAIVDFVARVTTEGSADFVPVPQRIAVFDNDGTLWCEQPLYVQFLFALDRIKATAADHPEWKEQEPFKSVLTGDTAGLLAAGEKGVLQIIAATHAGMTTDEFDQIVREWFQSAKNPKFGRPCAELVYQPMLEVLAYLRARGFRTFIVSGGGVEFMRAFASEAYGIAPDQMVGSMGKLKFELRDGKPVLMKLPEVDFIDDGEGKPIAIQRSLGQRPLIAFGNSDGDLAMLQWTTSAPGARLGLIVHHTDGEREVAYDRASHVGRLDKALDAAGPAGWVLIDMQQDWNAVFPAEPLRGR